jgi:SNF2 family DNA or RNA helicase
MKMNLAVRKYVDFCKSRNIDIKSHQVYGILWCLQRENIKKGGIVADEMGMGKTIQMIGTMILNPRRKTLIILPPILIQQWYLEIQRICGHRAILYYGKKNREKITKNKLENAMIVITSYETCIKDEILGSIFWNRIICDEAHHLRNSKTKTYEKIKGFETEICWCLTGTPIHNSPKDLFSLFHLCNIEKENRKHHFLQRFRDTTITNGPIIVKKENRMILEWKNEREREMAKDIHASISCLGFKNNENQESFWEKTKTCTLVSMIRASQMCIFPKMIESSFVSRKEEEDLDIPEEYITIFESQISTKLQSVLSHIIERKKDGNGKIIFCHFRLEIQRIISILQKNGVEWVGTWKSYQKIKENDEIKTPILIMQIRSGCEGLNLQSHFSEVYFVSPNWNPALESQAIGRCFRIGQKKQVNIYRFYMNYVDSPMNNTKYREEIIKYKWLYTRLPMDITKYIISFQDPIESAVINKCSLDKYIQLNQDKKKEKIELCLKDLR